MKSFVKRIMNDDWASIQTDVEQMAAKKVKDRVENKKYEVLAKMNNINVEKQKEIMSIK